MNTKTAILNISDVPKKFNKSGGTIDGSIQVNGSITAENHSVFRDGFTSNGLVNWITTPLHLGVDKEANIGLWIDSLELNNTVSDKILFNGNKIYHAGDKPTADEIGAATVENGTIVVPANNSAGARIKNFAEDKQNFTTLMSSRLDSRTWAMHSIGVNDEQGPIYEIEDPNSSALTTRYKIYHEGFKPTSLNELSVTNDITTAQKMNAAAYNFDRYTNWSNTNINATGGGAGICNDNVTYKCLMILGNNSENGRTRKVSVWDDLHVNGKCSVDSFKIQNKNIYIQQSTPTGLGSADAGTVWITW